MATKTKVIDPAKSVIGEREEPEPVGNPPTERPHFEEVKGKSQKVKILVSVFRYGDKIVSALGIPTPTTFIRHEILKSKLKPDEIFNIISALTNDPYFKNNKMWEDTVRRTLDNGYSVIPLAEERANELSKKTIGKLVHEILDIEIVLFMKM